MNVDNIKNNEKIIKWDKNVIKHIQYKIFIIYDQNYDYTIKNYFIIKYNL